MATLLRSLESEGIMKFTSEDLLKAMGLKVGQTVCVDNSMNFFITERNDVMFENLRSHSMISIEKFIEYAINYDYIIIQPKPTLTEDEKVILRNLGKKWKWIARDNYEQVGLENHLCLFEHKPNKNTYWFEVSEGNTEYLSFDCYNHLFKFIKWEDEPYSIEELLGE